MDNTLTAGLLSEYIFDNYGLKVQVYSIRLEKYKIVFLKIHLNESPLAVACILKLTSFEMHFYVNFRDEKNIK